MTLAIRVSSKLIILEQRFFPINAIQNYSDIRIALFFLLAPESKTGKTKNVNKDKENIKRIIILYIKIWVDIFIPTQI